MRSDAKVGMRAFLCGIAFLLGGCATTGGTEILDPLGPASMPEGANSGVLVLQVVDTTPLGQAFPITQLTLASRDLNAEEDALNLRAIAVEDAPGQGSTFFMTELPAGEYAFSSLRSFHQLEESYVSQFYPGGIELGTFEVQPGRLTDLGAVAVFIDRTAEDYTYATVRLPYSARGAALLNQREPSLAGRLERAGPSISWVADDFDDDRAAAYRRAVQRQIVFGIPLLDEATRELVYPANLGVVVSRDEAGNWSLDGFPADEKLVRMSRLHLPDGSVDLVLTEFNELYVRGEPGEDWRQVSAPDPDGELLYVGVHEQFGLYALSRESMTVTIWTSPALDSAWARHHVHEPKMGFFEALNNYGIASELKGGVVVATDSGLVLAIRNSLLRFDFETGVFVDTGVRNPESVSQHNDAVTVRTGGLFAGFQVSRDGGRTWSSFRGGLVPKGFGKSDLGGSRRTAPKVDRVDLLGHPIFVDESIAFAVHAPEADGEPARLVRTDDGAKLWEEIGSPLPDGCFALAQASDSEILVHCFLSGEFYRSEDSGRSWELERSVSEA